MAKTSKQPISRDHLDEAHDRVISRIEEKGETVDEAIEAVYPDYGGPEFAKRLKAFVYGDRVER